jgi:spermidine synthase
MRRKEQKGIGEEWLEEVVDANEKKLYRIQERIYFGESKYQKIEILRLANQGITLVLDGYPRVFEVDEFLYHEALIHPALHLHKKTKSILLIGDGDGGGIRELLKYREVNRIDWVEIDKEVVKVCKSFLPSFPKDIHNESRLRTFWTDGFKFLKEADENQYDCVFISVTEQLSGNVSQPFYTKEVLNYVKRLLKPGGYCVQSAGITSPGLLKSYKEVFYNHEQVFANVSSYSVGLPSFGLSWGFCLSSDVSFSKWESKIPNPCLKYYDEFSHKTMFLIPKYMKADLGI